MYNAKAMIWINKRNKHYRKKAHRIINQFIHNAWSVSDQRYIGLTFDDLKKVKKFKSLLFNEQHGYCCYCMRKLDLSKSHLSTIEHILPHKIKITDYNDIAFYYSYIPFFHKYVKVLSPKSIKGKLKNGRPYPHFCAYENLVLSCSGAIFKSNFPENEYPSKLHECCNNKRGNKLILPFFYLKQPMLCYEKDGCITYDDNNILLKDTIDTLNLDGNENLRTIRRIWGNIFNLYSVHDVQEAGTNKQLREEILQDTDLDHNLAKRFFNPLYWQLVIEYEWFYSYFNFSYTDDI